ncbi:MAG: glycosyltransferase family 2 protein [Bacillota bacterium]
MKMKDKNKQQAKDKPLVTVVTTVLNGAKHIEQAIQSVLDQTYDNIEYIITDGGSTDGTLDIINKYKDYLSHYTSEPDNGIYDGINKGIRLAKGDYIIILNSDDYYVKDAVELLVQKALKTGADIVAGHALNLSEEDNILKRKKSRWGADIYIRSTLRHEAMLVAAKAYNCIGLYDISKRVISDRLWMIKAFEHNLKVVICDHDILYFRTSGISSVGDNGFDVRLKESIDHLHYLDPTLREKDLLKLANPWKLTTEEIKYYLKVYSSKKLRNALAGLPNSSSSKRRKKIFKTISVFIKK